MSAVSVLIRTTGRKAALRDALDSLTLQTIKDFEVIIVEDGPATLNVFLAAYSTLNIRYEALGVRRGRSAAGNRALALATGKYDIFLDEDDAFYPDHIRLLLDSVRTKNRPIAYSFSEERAVERAPDGGITRRARFKRYRYESFSLLQLIAGNYIPINAVLFERTLFEKAGGFDEELDCLEDWLLWLRYAALAPEWICVPQVTAIYHVPLAKASRRKEFHAWRPKVEERMHGIMFSLSGKTLACDARRFNGAIFLRKLYYYIIGYVKW